MLFIDKNSICTKESVYITFCKESFFSPVNLNIYENCLKYFKFTHYDD